MKTNNKLLLGAAALAFLLYKATKKQPQGLITGIGATKKRRIYKELSLAQQAGVDFTKPYEDLDEDEIEALERVSHDTGYTETYYKSLQKAYNAVSGIGEAYDVTDADGNTVLTWIEDPEQTQPRAYSATDDAERYAALREAHDIEDQIRWAEEEEKRRIEEQRQRTLEAEARAAESRKRLKATQRAIRNGQQSLFGCGYSPEVEHELWEIWREQIEYGDTDYDYDTWRKLVANEYLPELLRYM